MFDKKEYQQQWYQQHKDTIHKYHKNYYQQHMEEILRKTKEHTQIPEVKEKIRIRMRKYHQLHYDDLKRWYYAKYREKHLKNHQILKEKVLRHYSPELKCQRCGFSDIRALSIDHINGDGCKHRRKIKIDLYRWLVNNNYPKEFQVLCMNCQFIKKVENNEYHFREQFVKYKSAR